MISKAGLGTIEYTSIYKWFYDMRKSAIWHDLAYCHFFRAAMVKEDE